MGAGTYHQLGGEFHLPVLVVGIRHLVEEKLGGNPAEPVARLAHGSQGYRCGTCELDVVIPDNGQIFRHPDAQPNTLLEKTEGDKVVGAHCGCGTRTRGQPGQPLTAAAPIGDSKRLGFYAGQLRLLAPVRLDRPQRAARRSRTWPIESELPTKAMRSWPSSSKWLAASSPPRMSSTDTEQCVWASRIRSTITTRMPRRGSSSSSSLAGSTGVMRTPCTRCCSRRSRYERSRLARLSLLQLNSSRSADAAASSMPRATSVKNGFAVSSIMYATVRLEPRRSCRADSLRTNPSSAIAASTLARVAAATREGRLRTLDTVPSDTPASTATSLTLAPRAAFSVCTFQLYAKRPEKTSTLIRQLPS